ncbi:MAG: hypothetical protein LBI01_03825 [Elusimicrobium sp.]|jgi:hypothetical protein|nr:hypothetical protein [Elusimicrobium sp.]
MKNLKPLVVYIPILAVGLFLIIINWFFTMPGCGGFHTGDSLACTFSNIWLLALCGCIGAPVGIYLSNKMQKRQEANAYTSIFTLSIIPLILITFLFVAGHRQKKEENKQEAVWQDMFKLYKKAVKGQYEYFQKHKFYADSYQKLGVEFPGVNVVACPAPSAAKECIEGSGVKISIETQHDNRSYMMVFSSETKTLGVEDFIVKAASMLNSKDINMGCDSASQQGNKMCKAFGSQFPGYEYQLKYGKMDYRINM